MSDDRPGDEGEAAQGGVFGNLPGSRPGTRSPRRAEASAAKAKRQPKRAAAKPKPKPAPRTKPKPPPRDPEPPAGDDAETGPEAERRDPAAGLEDLAWAGVAAAAEAATLGVRLAGRAIDALRGGTDRR